MADRFLIVQGLSAGYGGGEVIRDIDLSVASDEVVCLLGPNGAGKTTLLRVLGGLLRPRSGSIQLGGVGVSDMAPHARARLGMAYVPEEQSTFAGLTVLENLRLGALPRGKASDRTWLQERLDQVFEVFPRLNERLNQDAATLSGGEQKMLVVGRALMSEPSILLLDEPSLGLAPQLVGQIFEALQEIQARRGIAVLVAEQNAERALGWASRAYILSDGHVRHEGPAADLRGDPELMGRLYLGEVV